jgi:mannitol/fructose-specific phosphotransferase system IIA component (Ntr-type)
MPTRFTDLVGPEDLLLPLEAADKWEAIDTLLHHAEKRGHFEKSSFGRYREAVLARERSMSTGMERGIAIPHAAVDGLSKLVGVMGVAKRPGGLAFDSIDAQPTTLVVLLLVPRDQKLAHIRTLADIARLLSRDEVRTALLECNSADGAWRVLRSADV